MARSRHRWISLPWSRCSFVAMLINLLSLPSVANIDAFNYFQSDQEFGRVTVDTELGQVVGRIFPGGVHGFLGIPYALPPVDKLRFEPPVPIASWGGGKLEALDFGAECIQSIEGNPTPPKAISEDCLFLNVWTPPGTKKDSKLPVMVWLYGGGFQQGASSHPEYDGKRLAERGVVVVSINYRLGALGWMVSVSDNLWGNYGLQDQRLGLEWVHDNVDSFGGDPGRVTLFGESAGAMSIGQHLHMDGAGVLFHKVIMQSNPIGYRFRSVTVANFLGEAVKRGMDCSSLDCLQTEPVSEVMRMQESLMGIPRSVGDFFTWGPVVTDRNYRRHVGKHQKTWKYEDHQAGEDERERRETRTVNLPGLGRKRKKSGGGSRRKGTSGGGDGENGDDDGGGGGGGNLGRSSSSRAAVRRGPKHDYTAPFMNVVQPLEALAEAAAAATTARARDAVGVRRAGGRFGAGIDGEKKAAAARGRPPVPVVLGVNAHEGLMFVHGAFPLSMPKMVYYSFVLGLFRLSMPRILDAYGSLADQCAESGDYRAVMSQIMHDYLFRCPNLRAAQLLQEKNGRDAPVFVYEFSHPTEVPGFLECSGSSCHTAELPYVFNSMEIIKENYSYHEASGPLAPSPPSSSTRAADGQGDANGGGGPLSAVTDALGGAAIGVGSALGGAVGGVGNAVGGVAGGVAGGVVGAVRSGFGVGQLLGWGGRQTASSPGEEVAGAIGGGGVGKAGRVMAGVTEKAQEVLAASAEEGKGGEGSGEQGGGIDGRGGRGEGARAMEDRGQNAGEDGDATGAAAGELSGGGSRTARGNFVGAGAADTAAAIEEGEGSVEREEACDTSGDGGSDVISGEASSSSDAGTDRSGLGGSSCAATAGEANPPPPKGPSRPSVREAALADARVAEAMVAYWASFGKTGDPNSASAPVVWPAWKGRRLTTQGNTAGAAAMAAVLASGRGGVGQGSFSDVFEEAWSFPGARLEAGGGSFPGASSWEGGPIFLDINAHPEPREAQRDCICEFWDRLKYRY